MNDNNKSNDGQQRSGKRRRRRRGKGGGPKQQDAQGQHQQHANQPQKGQGQSNHMKPRHGDARPNSGQNQQKKQGNKPKQQQQRDKQPAAPKMRVAEDLRTAERQRDQQRSEAPFVHVERRYGIAIYDSLQAAKADLESLKAKANEFDQLNIVIRAESNMDDPELNAIPKVKVFAGTAWTLIHERRLQDGWYEAPR